MIDGALLQVLMLAVASFVLVRAGTWVVRALLSIAAVLRMSEYTVSFVLMSFATTLPEFSVAVSAALRNEGALALGNALGSNIFNLAFILGFAAAITGKVLIDKEVASRDAWIVFLLAVSPVVLLLDFELSRIDGFILVAIFFAYLSRLLNVRKMFRRHLDVFHLERPNREAFVPGGSLIALAKNFGLFVVAVGLLLVSAHFIVESAVSLSRSFGVSEFIIGVFLVAVGTSLPELVFGVRAIVSRHSGLSLGNLIGASVLNSTFVLGIAVLIAPFSVTERGGVAISAFFMSLVFFVTAIFLRTKNIISRRGGGIFLALYVLFVLVMAL